VHTVPSSGRNYGAQARRLRRVLRTVQPAVVHSHGYLADALLFLASIGLGIPRVSTVHGFTGGGSRNRLYEWVQVRILARFDAIIAVAQTAGVGLVKSGVPPSRVRVIPNRWVSPPQALSRVDARRRLGLPQDGFVVGWVGRLSQEKGPDLFLRALARTRTTSIQAAIIGGGGEKEALNRLAGELDVGSRVRWCGVHLPAAELLRAFDVLMLTSRTEGTPMILLESVSIEVPIIATAVGGIPAMFDPGDVALVPFGKTVVEDLARALDEVAIDPSEALRRAATAASRPSGEKCSEWGRDYQAVYEALLSSGKTM